MNKFFKYKVSNKEYGLTEKEHNQILELIKQGKSGLIVLRKGNLIINLSFISSVEEIIYKSDLEKLNIPDEYLLK